MLNYPSKNVIIETLVEAARESVIEENLNHPEDFAVRMASAVEDAGRVLTILMKNNRLK